MSAKNGELRTGSSKLKASQAYPRKFATTCVKFYKEQDASWQQQSFYFLKKNHSNTSTHLAKVPFSQAKVADLPRRLFPEITRAHPEPYDVWLDFDGLVCEWLVVWEWRMLLSGCVSAM